MFRFILMPVFGLVSKEQLLTQQQLCAGSGNMVLWWHGAGSKSDRVHQGQQATGFGRCLPHKVWRL
jgi:hypothetical protein